MFIIQIIGVTDDIISEKFAKNEKGFEVVFDLSLNNNEFKNIKLQF